jgi:hypothetical protein
VVLAVPAAAKVPKFNTRQPAIVPGISIGGVSAGMTMTQAKAAWGAPDKCSSRSGLTTCAYTLPHAIEPQNVAIFYVKGGRVVAVELDSPEDAGALAKVEKLKTAKGIHVGSPIAAARNKYGIPVTGGGEANLSRADLKSKNRCTQFYAPEAPYKTITSITVGICKSVIGLYF